MDLNKDAINLKKKLDKIKQKKLSDKKSNEDVKSTDNSFENISKEEILSEYFLFLKNLPVLLDHELNRLINTVKCSWDIEEILNSPLNPEALMHKGQGNFLSRRLCSHSLYRKSCFW